MKSPITPRHSSVLPTPKHAELALRELAVLMTPIVRWLLRNGVPYPVFAEALKAVFVEVARQELQRGDAPATQSALSVLSGVHRKDVRTLTGRDPSAEPEATHNVPLPSQVFTRWVSDPSYRGRDGLPLPLARSGPSPSFDALARAVTTDVHPRTVLDELLRLGVVRLDGETVVPLATSFVPAEAFAEMVELFSANDADHLAAAVHNLTLDAPKFLEQSVFADGLTEASARELASVAREAWAQAFATMVARASQRVEGDRDLAGTHRMRFGAYFFSESKTKDPVASADGDEPAARRTQRAARARGNK